MNPRQLFALEVVRYGLVSVIAFAVDVALLWLLVKIVGIHYLASAAISFLAGGVVAYVLAVRWVFRHRRVQQRSVEGVTFVVLGLAGLGVNTVAMALLVGRIGAPLLLAKCGAACATFGVNFLLRKWVLFTPRAGARESMP